ncbi:MAG: CHAT domain-containing protein [Anaerolineae bacterium]|nr:CHAT domain-containing protein [Anaerolineae bacterium]
MMQHEDFVITMTDVHEGVKDNTPMVMFRVSVPGRVTEGQETGYDKRALGRLTASWDVAPPTLKQVVSLGQLLGDALFPTGPLRDAFLSSLSVHKHATDSRLRVVLTMGARELQLVPWEFALFHTEQGEATQNEILGLMSQISIARQLDTTAPKIGTKSATHPVPMVMALADPTYTLNLEKERGIVEDSLKNAEHIQATYVENATAATLLGGLDRVHLFHFAGHGTFIERNTPGATFGTGTLILDDGAGGQSFLDAPQIAERLVNAGVRVAVLGACLTAKRDHVQMWSSTAANLINGGLGAVVGMQYVIADNSAIAFAKAFYEALALGFPVDQAVTKGRIAIFELGDCRGFGTPVLYMGDCDGKVFPEFTDEPVLIEERAKLRLLVNLSVGTVAGTVTGIEVEKMSEGQAKADITTLNVDEGGLVAGFEAGSLTGGDVDVKIKAGDVAKGATVVGIQAKEVGAGKVFVQETAGNVSGNLVGFEVGDL